MINDIKCIVYTSDIDPEGLYPQFKGEKISVLDPRSAVYIATGIAAQNNETVMVMVDAGNSSRSAFSGMTEAFYRNLPVILVTVGKVLNYDVGLNDPKLFTAI